MSRIVRPSLIALTALAITAAPALSACGGGSRATTEDGITTVDFLISYQQGPVFYPFSVARRLDYFKQEGLSVKVQPTKGSSYVTQQLLAEKVDFGIANGPADIIAFSKNHSVQVPVCYQERAVYYIQVPEGSPVKSVADLKGRVLGTTEVGSGEYPYAEAALRDAGLDPKTDVRLLPIGDGSAETVDAIRNRKVDAYISEGLEFRLMTVRDGLRFTDITPSIFRGIPGSCFVTTKQALQNPAKRKLFVGIARAFLKGVVFGIANPAVLPDIVCDDLPQTCQDRSILPLQFEWATTEATPVTPGVPNGGIDIAGWQEAAKVALGSGQIKEAVDVNQLVNTPEATSARNEILNFDVEAIRQAAKVYSGS
jgi:ABC-type nitrate/sulfonate/bicarbonate transport system substrate-binding protein